MLFLASHLFWVVWIAKLLFAFRLMEFYSLFSPETRRFLEVMRIPDLKISASCCFPVKRPEMLLLLLFIFTEWSNRNCGAISEFYRYLPLPNYYSSFDSQCAVSTKSVPQSDFLSLENTTKRASGWRLLCFLLMNTPLSPWPDNMKYCAFAEWK